MATLPRRRATRAARGRPSNQLTPADVPFVTPQGDPGVRNVGALGFQDAIQGIDEFGRELTRQRHAEVQAQQQRQQALFARVQKMNESRQASMILQTEDEFDKFAREALNNARNQNELLDPDFPDKFGETLGQKAQEILSQSNLTPEKQIDLQESLIKVANDYTDTAAIDSTKVRKERNFSLVRDRSERFRDTLDPNLTFDQVVDAIRFDFVNQPNIADILDPGQEDLVVQAAAENEFFDRFEALLSSTSEENLESAQELIDSAEFVLPGGTIEKAQDRLDKYVDDMSAARRENAERLLRFKNVYGDVEKWPASVKAAYVTNQDIEVKKTPSERTQEFIDDYKTRHNGEEPPKEIVDAVSTHFYGLPVETQFVDPGKEGRDPLTGKVRSEAKSAPADPEIRVIQKTGQVFVREPDGSVKWHNPPVIEGQEEHKASDVINEDGGLKTAYLNALRSQTTNFFGGSVEAGTVSQENEKLTNFLSKAEAFARKMAGNGQPLGVGEVINTIARRNPDLVPETFSYVGFFDDITSGATQVDRGVIPENLQPQKANAIVESVDEQTQSAIQEMRNSGDVNLQQASGVISGLSEFGSNIFGQFLPVDSDPQLIRSRVAFSMLQRDLTKAMMLSTRFATTEQALFQNHILSLPSSGQNPENLRERLAFIRSNFVNKLFGDNGQGGIRAMIAIEESAPDRDPRRLSNLINDAEAYATAIEAINRFLPLGQADAQLGVESPEEQVGKVEKMTPEEVTKFSSEIKRNPTILRQMTPDAKKKLLDKMEGRVPEVSQAQEPQQEETVVTGKIREQMSAATDAVLRNLIRSLREGNVEGSLLTAAEEEAKKRGITIRNKRK